VETARIWGIEPKIELRLTEANWGDWEGMTLTAIRREIGGNIPGIDFPDIDFRPPGGESGRMVQDRLKPWLKEVAVFGAPMAAVTHKGVIQAALALALGETKPQRVPKITAGSLHHFVVDNRGGLAIDKKAASSTCMTA
jgi:broad specificity phosphatase PhoE